MLCSHGWTAQLYLASRPLDPFAQSHNVETGALDARFSASLAPGTSWVFAWGDHRPVKTPALATVVVQEGQEQPACWHVGADDVPNVRGVLSELSSSIRREHFSFTFVEMSRKPRDRLDELPAMCTRSPDETDHRLYRLARSQRRALRRSESHLS